MESTFAQQRSGYDPEAIAAREAEILGKPQRVESLPVEELSAEGRALIDRIRSSIGLPPATEYPGYTLMMIKHPELFRLQLELGTVIFQGRVPARERELAVLRIGWVLRAPYEWGEHVDIGQRYGVTKEEIERVIEGPDAPGWTEHETAILRAVDELLSNQTISDATFDTLARSWDDQQLIEFPMMVGQYVCTAFIQNSLRVRLERDNPGLTYR